MTLLGVQMMMVKDAVARDGMWPVLQRIHELGYETVEMSQIPMDDANTAALERAGAELGLKVAALSVALQAGRGAVADSLDRDFDKVVNDCRRLNARYVRIGMMPLQAMATRDACEAWAADGELAAQRLAPHGVTLCYHNHHVDLARFDGERIFDIVRRVAPSVHFEVDLHWVQRGGGNPIDMLAEYAGVVDLIHVKDYRVVPLPAEAIAAQAAGDRDAFQRAFNGIVQFAEVGAGNMNWPAILPQAERSGAQHFLVEQDDTYGRDPFDCLADSRAYLRSIGY